VTPVVDLRDETVGRAAHHSGVSEPASAHFRDGVEVISSVAVNLAKPTKITDRRESLEHRTTRRFDRSVGGYVMITLSEVLTEGVSDVIADG
jgi:hypothetical protein